MEVSNLLDLVKYSKCPTCVHIKLVDKENKIVKKYRYKYEDFASFLEKAQRSEFLEKTKIDELVVQRSLLNDEKEFIMIYCTKVQMEFFKDEGK